MNDNVAIPNRPEDEMARLMMAAREALTDSMVERLTVTSAAALEVVDKLNDEDTRDAIMQGLDRITELHRIGAMDTLFDLVTLIHGARNALTDSMIERLFTFMETMINTVGTEDLATVADHARNALDDALDQTADAKPKGGLMATIALFSNPKTLETMEFLLAFGEHLKRRTAE